MSKVKVKKYAKLKRVMGKNGPVHIIIYKTGENGPAYINIYQLLDKKKRKWPSIYKRISIELPPPTGGGNSMRISTP